MADDYADVQRVRVKVLPDGRIDRSNAAAALGRTPKTLAEWNCKGIGPRPFHVGGRVFYKWDEVIAIARGEKPVAAWADAA